MQCKKVLKLFPERFPQSTAPGAPAYERRDSYVAVHGGPPIAGLVPELEFGGDDGPVRVYRDDSLPAGWDAEGRVVTPVYALGGEGGLAIPTGRVFLRFADGVDFAAKAPELEAAGFRPVGAPGRATNAGWAAPSSSQPADGLNAIDRLADLPDLAHAEPQLLRPAARKGK